MSVNLDQQLLDLDGEPLLHDNQPATLRRALLLTLLTAKQDDAMLPPGQRLQLFELAQKINPGGEVDFQPEDVVLFKDRGAKVLPDVVMLGRMLQAL